MLETVLPNTTSRSAITTTGMDSSISAIGPCLSSRALRVDIAQLFELEWPLERDRIGRSAAEVENVACARFLSDLFARSPTLKNVEL
jgi:hypothetical protein